MLDADNALVCLQSGNGIFVSESIDDISQLILLLEDTTLKNETFPATTLGGRTHIELVTKFTSDQLRQQIPNNTRSIVDKVFAEYFNSSKYYNSTFQFVNSKPNSLNQIWHADNKHPGLTIIIPLVHIDVSNGPTQIIGGTSTMSKPSVCSPKLKCGQIIVFDSRLLHRFL